LNIRIDHRSFKRQGVNREPAPVVPAKVFYAERQSQKGSAAGNAIAELSRVQQNQQARLKTTAIEDSKRKGAQPKKIPWAALTREERNARRRELRAIERTDPVAEAKRRAVRQAEYQALKQRNPEATKEAARRWRAAHPEKSREAGRRWWTTHGKEVNRKKRELRKNRTQELSRSKSTSPSAEESAQLWKKYRETHGPGPTAEESARNWLAMRERGAFLPEAQTPGTREQDREVASRDDEDDDRKQRRQYDHDFEL
jgi:hypothetical protein